MNNLYFNYILPSFQKFSKNRVGINWNNKFEII